MIVRERAEGLHERFYGVFSEIRGRKICMSQLKRGSSTQQYEVPSFNRKSVYWQS